MDRDMKLRLSIFFVSVVLHPSLSSAHEEAAKNNSMLDFSSEPVVRGILIGALGITIAILTHLLIPWIRDARSKAKNEEI